MKVKLLLLSTAVKPNEFNVTLPAKIGRGKEASLRLVHSQISRLHCELFEQDGQLLVRDLASLNGTFVDEQRVEDPCALVSGCKLKVGSVEFQVQIGDAVAPITPPERSNVPDEAGKAVATVDVEPASAESAKAGNVESSAVAGKAGKAEGLVAAEGTAESGEVDVAWLFEDDEPPAQKAEATPAAEPTIQVAPAAAQQPVPSATKAPASTTPKPSQPAKKPLPVAKAEPDEKPTGADSETTTMWKPVPAAPAKQPAPAAPAAKPATPPSAKPAAAPAGAKPAAPAKPPAEEPQFEVGPGPAGEEPDPDLDEFFKSIM